MPPQQPNTRRISEKERRFNAKLTEQIRLLKLSGVQGNSEYFRIFSPLVLQGMQNMMKEVDSHLIQTNFSTIYYDALLAFVDYHLPMAPEKDLPAIRKSCAKLFDALDKNILKNSIKSLTIPRFCIATGHPLNVICCDSAALRSYLTEIFEAYAKTAKKAWSPFPMIAFKEQLAALGGQRNTAWLNLLTSLGKKYPKKCFPEAIKEMHKCLEVMKKHPKLQSTEQKKNTALSATEFITFCLINDLDAQGLEHKWTAQELMQTLVLNCGQDATIFDSILSHAPRIISWVTETMPVKEHIDTLFELGLLSPEDNRISYFTRMNHMFLSFPLPHAIQVIKFWDRLRAQGDKNMSFKMITRELGLKTVDHINEMINKLGTNYDRNAICHLYLLVTKASNLVKESSKDSDEILRCDQLLFRILQRTRPIDWEREIAPLLQ